MICKECKLTSRLIGDTHWADGRCPGCAQMEELWRQERKTICSEPHHLTPPAVAEEDPDAYDKWVNHGRYEDEARREAESPFYPGTLVRR